MEYGTLVHRSSQPNKYKEVHGMENLQLSTNLLDLHPIDNVWKVLQSVVQKESLPKNKEELVNTIQQTWKDLSMETLEVFISSMPFCMMVEINARCGSTKW